MQEGNNNQEMDFGDPTVKTSTSEPEEVKESVEPAASVVVDKEELEQFVLNYKRMFEDIPGLRCFSLTPGSSRFGMGSYGLVTKDTILFRVTI